MITAIVLYDLPPSIGLEECRAHFTKIAPDFLKAKGFLRKQFICRKDGGGRARVIYALTAQGRSLRPVLEALFAWGRSSAPQLGIKVRMFED